MAEVRACDRGRRSAVETHSSATRVWKDALDLMRIAREINPRGGLDNCVDCAVAFDHAIAGKPMTAENTSRKSGDKLAAAYGVTSKAFVEFASAAELLQHVVEQGIEQGIVMAVVRRPDPVLPDVRQVVDGHVVNVASDGKQTFFFDAQAGMPQTARVLDSDPLWDGFFLLVTDEFHRA